MEATRVAMPMSAPAPVAAVAAVAAVAGAAPTARAASRNNNRQNKPSRNRVVVSGYPPYTQPQDLIRVFSKFGSVKVEKLGNKLATLSYPSEEDAKKAIAASTEVIVYGEFLTVKLFDAKEVLEEVKQAQQQKRDFSRSKQKSVIIEPKDIDLSGTFHQQLERVLAAVRLTQEQVANLCSLYTHLENALRVQWPGCSAVPFGSIPTGLGIRTSDADCFISLPPQPRAPAATAGGANAASANANLVNKAHRVLRQYPHIFAETISIPRANTPIVKFFHIPTETNCDVTFKTPLGAQNSKLIAYLLHSDPRLLPVAVVIKYWAKVHDLSGTGKLTNYALTMLVIFYLQQPPMSVLPSVRWLQADPADDVIVDGWNTGFSRKALPPSMNTSSISELLGGFFEYYSNFNFEELVVCPYLGTPIKKELFKMLNQVPVEFERYKSNVSNDYVMPMRFNTPICVQDPFEQCHNVALPITSRLASDIKAFFKFAADAYENEKLKDCNDFFKVILLQKPKIIRGKTHPDFRVNLFPRIINNIINPDWKPIVRQTILDIFEKLLKIKMTKMEDIPTTDSKKEKEKYTGTITKAIWKRKQFTKLYSVMKLKFQQKQEKITEEILLVDKQVINIEFHLVLTFCNDPKSTVMLTRLATGDVDAFREFGKFYMTVMYHWFIELLRPHTKPVKKDCATKQTEDNQFLDSLLNSDDESQASDEETAELADRSVALDEAHDIAPAAAHRGDVAALAKRDNADAQAAVKHGNADAHAAVERMEADTQAAANRMDANTQAAANRIDIDTSAVAHHANADAHAAADRGDADAPAATDHENTTRHRLIYMTNTDSLKI